MTLHPSTLARIAHIKILIMDSDYRIAELVKRVLNNLGFKHIFYAKNGRDGLKMLRTEKIDMVITDWDMEPMNGIDFINYIRTSDKSPNRLLPIIMLTGKTQHHNVTIARDAGITEFVVKPFSAKTICNRIVLVVEHPRNFVLSSAFTGPDRRRRNSFHKDADRRKKIDEKKAFTTEIAGKKVIKLSEDVTIIDADYRLKNKIGHDFSLKDLFTTEAIQSAQKVINDSADEFITLIRHDLELLERYYVLLIKSTEERPDDISAIATIALSIKSRAGTFNYALASHVADSLYNSVIDSTIISERRSRSIRIHIDTLYVIFNGAITEMGGAEGKEIIAMLAKLIKHID